MCGTNPGYPQSPTYSRRFIIFLANTFDFEGEASNDASDPGGSTMFGLSSRSNPELADSIKARTLSKQKAIDYIYRKYYKPILGIDQMDGGVAFLVFDARFHGMVEVIKSMQVYINSVNDDSTQLAVDGMWGPNTLRKVNQLSRSQILTLIDLQNVESATMARRAADRVLVYQTSHRLPRKDYFAGFKTRQDRRSLVAGSLHA